mgnify:CR=1 FL=1
MEKNIQIPLLERHSRVKTEEELIEIYLRLFQQQKGAPEKSSFHISRKDADSFDKRPAKIIGKEEIELEKTLVLEQPEKTDKPPQESIEGSKGQDELANTLILESEKEKDTEAKKEEEGSDEEQFVKTMVLDASATQDATPSREEGKEGVEAPEEGVEEEEMEIEGTASASENDREETSEGEAEVQASDSKTGRPRPGKKKKRKKRGLEALK